MLTAAQRGESWACTELWTSYSPMVTGFARARGSREPEDLTSEVFLSLFRSLGAFAGDEAAFRGYLFTIAHRRLVDEFRASSRRPYFQLWTDDGDDRYTGSAEDEVVSASVETEIIALLDELSPDQREVLTLRLIADLPIEQVAAIVGKTPGAVKALQHRALAALRRRLQSHTEDASTVREESAR